MNKINSHGHLLPYPHQIPKFMKEKKFFWISSCEKYMCQENWQRPTTHESFFLNGKIEWMDKHNIIHQVILTLSQLYCNGRNRQDTHDIIRFQNDFNAQTQAEHTERFTTGFVVQPAYIDDSLKEIERCVHEHGLKILCLPTHYLNQDNEWLSVADPSLDPIYELANELKLAIEIHPYDADKMVNIKNTYWRHHLVWMMAQTADTYMMYALQGIAQKYPNIRTCFAHGAMLAQANHARVIQGLEGRPDLFANAHHPNETLGHKNIYFDTLVHDPYTLQLMVNRHGSDQVLWGVDDPYPLGEMETVKSWYPGKLLDDSVEKNIITPEQRIDIWHDNVLRWING